MTAPGTWPCRSASNQIVLRLPTEPARARWRKRPRPLIPMAPTTATFSVDPAAGIVIHHLEGSLNPSDVGKDNVRYYELEGNRVTLSIADDDQGRRLARKDTSAHLIWERIEPR